MSSVCILTPIVIGSWPAISSAVLGAAAAMGFSVAAGERHAQPDRGVNAVETDVPNSEVLAETLSRNEKIRIHKAGVDIEVGVDDRGACTACVSGKGKTKAELKKIGDEVVGRIVQQFAYHKLATELKNRGYHIAEEAVQADQSIQLRVRLGR